MMSNFWLCFVPLFVAVDALGVLPIFIGLTEGLERRQVRRILWQSVLTAMIVALSFLALGKAILNLLGVTIADFMIAGGALLFVLALREHLLFDRQPRLNNSECPECIGAVPIGVPLIVGPAVLTTSILLAGEYGVYPAVSAVILNIVIAGIIFALSYPINRFLGSAGTKAISKLAGLILAAIGVMMVRKGIMTFVAAGSMQ